MDGYFEVIDSTEVENMIWENISSFKIRFFGHLWKMAYPLPHTPTPLPTPQLPPPLWITLRVWWEPKITKITDSNRSKRFWSYVLIGV